MKRLMEEKIPLVLLLALSCWLLTNAASLYALYAHHVLLVRTYDPDSWLRLHIVSTLYQTGEWFNHTILRDNAPYGIDTPWTRPVDVLLLLLAAPFLPWIPFHTAIQVAAVLLNAVLLILCMLSLWPIIRQRLAYPHNLVFLVLALATAPIPQLYFAFGFADHHSLLVTLYCVILYGCYRMAAIAPPRWPAWVSGICIGLGIWATVEFQLPTALILGWMLWMWVWSGERVWLIRAWQCTAAALLVVTCAILLERTPDRWFIPIYDSVSIVQWSSLLGGWLLISALWLLQGKCDCRLKRFSAGCIMALLAGAVLLFSFPLLPDGPMAMVSPAMKAAFLDYVFEMQSITRGGTGTVIAAYLLSVIGGAGAVVMAGRRIALSPFQVLLLCLNIAFGILILFASRQIYYLYIPAILLAAETLALYYRRHLRVSLVVTILIALLPYYGDMGGRMLTPPTREQKENSKKRTCYQEFYKQVDNGNFVKFLGDHPYTLLMPQNVGTYALFQTPYSIVSANYHRNERGYLEQIEVESWKVPARALQILKERKVDILMICASGKYETVAPLTNYIKTSSPTWLEPVPELTKKKKYLYLYRVHRELFPSIEENGGTERN